MLCQLSYAPIWQGWLDLNQRMRESKSRALPLGYTPILDAEALELNQLKVAYETTLDTDLPPAISLTVGSQLVNTNLINLPLDLF